MDQDAFRQLLHRSSTTPKQPSPTPAGRPNKKATSAKPSEPAFKPRKVKKADQKYRDRASERREGISNDYAEVEAILEDFEKRATREGKDVIEEQRKYLGGDSQHTILVKGLDVSLLEQNKARVAASTEEDDVLEQAFVEATSQVTEPVTRSKKRTREEIIRELKAKRQNGQTEQPLPGPSVKTMEEERLALEAAKQSGKFRPIGFKPIGQEEKPKKRRIKNDKNGEKKRRKVDKDPKQTGQEPDAGEEPHPLTLDKPPSAEERRELLREPQPEPQPEPLDEDFDIFVGAGDYQGIPDDDEDDGGRDGATHSADLPLKPPEEPSHPTQPVKGGWFDDAEREHTPLPTMHVSAPKSPPEKKVVEEEQEGRLKALESSALPSIRDFLAMQEAAEKAEKRRARKEKKKKKKKGGDDDDD
ncbi:RED-like protein N-terminal region-domain-containing protein [Pisolithus croceorrhizus]|nr:RED-like protein N-terminal region-domain-containing protein [Pisolithus croceorrhizus]KAI6130120.1 RED-like protein N-terminal region-domain-containing protein [Pisolithus croceorrhizus]